MLGFLNEIEQHKETPVSINTITSSADHVKSIVHQIQSSDELPFKEILSAELLSEKIATLEYRDRVFPPDMTIFAFLSQVMGQDQSCSSAVTQVIAHLARCGEEIPSMNTAAYCKARARLPEKILSELAKETAEELEKEVKLELLWRGRHIKLPDGTAVSMPDTAANQAAYPQSNTQKKELDFQLLGW
jgi:Insertion element 4 transposase N-terminal